MTNDEAKLVAVAQKLLENAGSGKLRLTKWAETGDPGTYQTSVENASIWVGASPSEDDEGIFRTPHYSIRVLNRSGTIVASLRVGPTDQGYPTLKQLHEVARREALQVDQTVDDLLQRLSP